jgi:hypothetical protein
MRSPMRCSASNRVCSEAHTGRASFEGRDQASLPSLANPKTGVMCGRVERAGMAAKRCLRAGSFRPFIPGQFSGVPLVHPRVAIWRARRTSRPATCGITLYRSTPTPTAAFLDTDTRRSLRRERLNDGRGVGIAGPGDTVVDECAWTSAIDATSVQAAAAKRASHAHHHRGCVAGRCRTGVR